ncbi:hypothetical protein [Thermodesulfobacterium sp.]|jgi:cell division transport system permease protein|uniref:hypothetical protein n=1 Tax=Thermodesulfobacterium sp. TaxID=1965289 RepID=UPI00257C1120|nr:hypothetical protein [Thermodesulfobacterium sp.]MBZ4681480.1 hypothetical protein [Thermodesulfobacterium sp.]
MFKLLAKLEIKKGLLYYLFFVLFFFFWNFFSLVLIYAYVGLFTLEKHWKDQITLSIFYYPKDQEQLNNFVKELRESFSSFTEKIEVVTPEMVLKQAQKTLPKEITQIFTEEELKENLPFLIKIYPKSLGSYIELTERLKLIAASTPALELQNPKYFKFLKLSFFLKSGIIGFWFSWIIVYIGAIFFINNLLNNLLYQQYKLILLLGGNPFYLKFIRLGFLVSLITLGFFSSGATFYLAVNSLTSIINFPLLDIFWVNSWYSLVYFIFLVVLIPFLSVWISFWGYEI